MSKEEFLMFIMGATDKIITVVTSLIIGVLAATLLMAAVDILVVTYSK